MILIQNHKTLYSKKMTLLRQNPISTQNVIPEFIPQHPMHTENNTPESKPHKPLITTNDTPESRPENFAERQVAKFETFQRKMTKFMQFKIEKQRKNISCKKTTLKNHIACYNPVYFICHILKI